jgi:hypothetical protein
MAKQSRLDEPTQPRSRSSYATVSGGDRAEVLERPAEEILA